MRMPRRLGRWSLLAVLAVVAGLVLAGPAQGTFPGPNGRIAFADFNTGQLYSINPDGTGLRQLTHLPAGAFAGHPDWSPDGRKIALFIDLSGQPRLYVMDRDGSHRHLVFSDLPGYLNLAPQYTPGGGRLIFSRCLPDFAACAIYSVRVDGTHLRALTRFQPSLDVVDFGPSVSPDGRRIAFTRFNAGGIQAQVYVMAADGSGAHPITPPALEGFPPEWTPDGRHILVSSNCCRLGSAIYQVNPDGSGLKRLTHPQFPHNDNGPSPSPQGNRIVFSSDRPYPDICCNDLFTMRADGSGLRRIETGLVGVVDADWGPAPPDTATATSTPTARQVTPARAGASAATLCARRPELRLLSRCGPPQQAFTK
jgi:Tol biopolymer transport system component